MIGLDSTTCKYCVTLLVQGISQQKLQLTNLKQYWHSWMRQAQFKVTQHLRMHLTLYTLKSVYIFSILFCIHSSTRMYLSITLHNTTRDAFRLREDYWLNTLYEIVWKESGRFTTLKYVLKCWCKENLSNNQEHLEAGDHLPYAHDLNMQSRHDLYREIRYYSHWKG